TAARLPRTVRGTRARSLGPAATRLGRDARTAYRRNRARGAPGGTRGSGAGGASAAAGRARARPGGLALARIAGAMARARAITAALDAGGRSVVARSFRRGAARRCRRLSAPAAVGIVGPRRHHPRRAGPCVARARRLGPAPADRPARPRTHHRALGHGAPDRLRAGSRRHAAATGARGQAAGAVRPPRDPAHRRWPGALAAAPAVAG